MGAVAHCLDDVTTGADAAVARRPPTRCVEGYGPTSWPHFDGTKIERELASQTLASSINNVPSGGCRKKELVT